MIRDVPSSSDELAFRKESVEVNGTGQRMLDRTRPPDADAVSKWIGAENYKRWWHILQFIETTYPSVFAPDWVFGGKKHGWGLRFRKSKSFCTLIPARNRLMIQNVLGAEEREKVELILPELSASVRAEYEEATTYHDGKWLGIVLGNDEVLADVKRLLRIKRKPKR